MAKNKRDATPQEVMVRPEIQAAMTISQWQKYPEGSLVELVSALDAQIDTMNAGSLARPEEMLLMQAHTLDTLFNSLAQKAHIQTHLPNYEAFLRMALRAQSQCRTTLETLATIKNPPVIFAKQANISNGHQQINNGVPVPSHAEDIKNQQNKILVEAQYGSTTMDINTTSKAVPVNSELEALE